MLIYILEDDLVQQVLLKRTLSKNSAFKLKSFTNVNDCLFEIAANIEPFILITDISMPKRNGISLIKELARYEHIHALLIVSGVESEVLDALFLMAKQAGIKNVKVLEKPVNLGVINNHISDVRQQFLVDSFFSKKPIVNDHVNELCTNVLHIALIERKFQAYFQPQINTATKKVRGVELLGRLKLNNIFYTPDKFILKLINEGLISQYTLLILDDAIKMLQKNKLDHLILSINVEYQSLIEPNFFKAIQEVLQRNNFSVNNLIVEVTENESNLNLNVISNLSELRLLGIAIAIDDFGQGHAGINELFTLPFTELKVDKKFMPVLNQNKKSEKMVKAICALAKVLNLNTVVEGIETFEQAEFFHSLNVECQQGFYYGKAVPIESLNDLICEIEDKLQYIFNKRVAV